MFCGKFIAKKRPLDLIDAARIIAASGADVNVHLLFGGSGEMGEALRAQTHVVFDADGLGGGQADAPVASFTGFLNQTEISRAYVAADCMVLASDHGETWGLVVNEAMASGLPCIVSNACGCAEDLIAPEWRYPCGDAGALAERIVALHTAGAPAPEMPLPTFDQTVAAIALAYAALT